MDTWIDAQAKIDNGRRHIKHGLKSVQEGLEMMERINESAKVQVHQIKESPAFGQRRRMHDE